MNWFETLVEAYEMKEVYSARGYIEKGKPLDPALFEKTVHRADRIPNDSITDIGELANKTTKYYIKRDTILRRFHLADTHSVVKGETVPVTSVNGGIALTVNAVALENASEGDTCALKNQSTAKEIRGVVRGGTVFISR